MTVAHLANKSALAPGSVLATVTMPFLELPILLEGSIDAADLIFELNEFLNNSAPSAQCSGGK